MRSTDGEDESWTPPPLPHTAAMRDARRPSHSHTAALPLSVQGQDAFVQPAARCRAFTPAHWEGGRGVICELGARVLRHTGARPFRAQRRPPNTHGAFL
jgi:hypothetical protein